jgi:hypothetical protein
MQVAPPKRPRLFPCRRALRAENAGVDVMHPQCIFMLSPVEKSEGRDNDSTETSTGDRGAEVRGKGPPGRFGGKRPDL